MVGFGDNIGSGFRKIMTAWKNIGFSNPDIHEENEVNEVWLTLPLTGTADDKNVIDSPENVTDSPQNVTNRHKNVTKTSMRRGSTLEILKSNPSITTEEIAKILKVSKRTILRDIEYLTNSKIIKREGGAFGGKWVINSSSF